MRNRNWKKGLYMSGGVVALVVAGFVYADSQTIVVQNEHVGTDAQEIAKEAKTAEMLDKKIREIKDEVMNKIKYGKDGSRGETAGHKISDGQVFYANDPRDALEGICTALNAVRNIECDSWGEWQFKIKTVMHYTKELDGKDITQVEALVIALDKNQADKLAERIIFEVKGGVWNWSVTKGHEAYYNEKISLVRELEAIRDSI